jgi:hypothetical protein
MNKLIIVSTISLAAIAGKADDNAFFQASLTPNIAIYSRTTEIDGLSLNIWGENPQHGVALGFVNGSTGDSAGFSWGLVNYSDTYHGVSWALVNVNQTSYDGWQSGWINVAQGDFVGFQSGYLVNYANNFQGLQLGLVNYAQNLNGVQIGLANIAMNIPWFSEFPDKLATGFPIVNWSF